MEKAAGLPARTGGAIVAAVLLLGAAPSSTTTTTPAPQRRSVPSARKPIAEFDRRRAMEVVRHLAGDIGVRVRASHGEYLASRFIARRFRRLGYDVRIQRFSIDNDVSRNVVAWWPGSRRYPFVIGGHMDTVHASPGANDNASGIAVMLENARLIAGKPPARNVRFVAFGSEEYASSNVHHVGSQVYVNRMHRRGRRRSPGMMSVDMVADGAPLIIGHAGIGPRVVARSLYRKMKRRGLRVSYRITCDCSDNGPFERAGLPGSFLWSGFEPNYHDVSDKPGNLRSRDMARAGRVVRAWLATLDGAMLTRFRRAH